MPFYINRKWVRDVGEAEQSLTSGKPLRDRRLNEEEISRNALITWQRQEISRLQKENQRLLAEKERLFEMLEVEQRIRANPAQRRSAPQDHPGDKQISLSDHDTEHLSSAKVRQFRR